MGSAGLEAVVSEVAVCPGRQLPVCSGAGVLRLLPAERSTIGEPQLETGRFKRQGQGGLSRARCHLTAVVATIDCSGVGGTTLQSTGGTGANLVESAGVAMG